MIELVSMWRVECDGCGCTLGDDMYDAIMYDTKEQAEFIAEESGWLQLGKRNHWYCPDCYVVDDDDNYVPVNTANKHKNQ